MLSIPRLPNVVADNAAPLAVTIVGAFLFRRLLGTVVSVFAMFAIGRLLLTALKVDLALAQRRTHGTPRN